MCQKNFVCRYEKCGLQVGYFKEGGEAAAPVLSAAASHNSSPQVEIIISGISYAGICYILFG